jgi:hypothetical protein
MAGTPHSGIKFWKMGMCQACTRVLSFSPKQVSNSKLVHATSTRAYNAWRGRWRRRRAGMNNFSSTHSVEWEDLAKWGDPFINHSNFLLLASIPTSSQSCHNWWAFKISGFVGFMSYLHAYNPYKFNTMLVSCILDRGCLFLAHFLFDPYSWPLFPHTH